MVWKILTVLLILFIAISIFSVFLALRKVKRMNRYTEVKKGMTEQEVFQILGKDYNDKVTKPNYVKYIWKITNANWTGVKRVEVELTDNKVIKVSGTK